MYTNYRHMLGEIHDIEAYLIYYFIVVLIEPHKP